MKWHDILGAVLADFLDGSPFTVETEFDLSKRKQLLDILVIRKTPGDFDRPLPHGFGPLENHNLISFKSHQESFDPWAMKELLAHYVNYRKQASPSMKDLLPETEFRVMGITSRYPTQLAGQVPFVNIAPGVFDVTWGTHCVRLLVIRDLPDEPVNAMLKLFSTDPKQIQYACEQYRKQSTESSSIIDELIQYYKKEDKTMATLAEIDRKIRRETIEKATPEERLRGLSMKEILDAISHKEILKEMSAEEIEAYLKEIKGNNGVANGGEN